MVALRKCSLIAAVVASMALARGLKADDRAMYLGFSGGMNVPTTNVDVRRETDQTREEIYEQADYNLDHGYALSASVGKYLREFRIEFQCAAQSNDIDSVEVQGTKSDLGGELDAMQFMGNVLYDIPLSKRVTAFLGAGVGAAEVWLRPDADVRHLENQHGMGFAYQGIAGIAWEIAPGVSITANYRAWTASDIEMQDVKLQMPLFHMAEIGVRFSF